MSSNQAGEGEIRKNIIEADLVDCMVALPGQLFYSTQIPACLWFLARDKSGKSPSPSLGQGWGEDRRFRDRRGQVLFIDARKLGRMVDRTHRELTDEEIARIARTYHAWRGTLSSPLPPGEGGGEGTGTFEYQDIPGFCESATLEEIRKHGHVLTPGRYVGAEAQEDYSEPFEEKMRRLTAQLREPQAEARRLDEAISKNLKELGYDA
jgi:type I restriction enzyme M protein